MKYSGGRRSSNTTTENDDGREATESYSRPLAENERERWWHTCAKEFSFILARKLLLFTFKNAQYYKKMINFRTKYHDLGAKIGIVLEPFC